MPSSVDVAIIGAGPAGTAAAIALAQTGYECAIIERSMFPRHRPGESLHPGIQPLMAQLGCEQEFLEAGFCRFPAVYVEADGESYRNDFGRDENGPWLGFQAWREDFDQLLLDRCRELGVQVRQPCRAVRPLRAESRVVGVDTLDGPLSAQFTVDAAGGRHWLAKHLDLSIREFSPQLVTRFGYSEVPQTESPLPRFITDRSGWTWHAQVRNGLYHWVRLTLNSDNSMDAGSQNGAHTERGADVTWRCVDNAAGPGYFMLGDAAAVLDPASSHGVLRAVMSGIMAANVVGRIVASPVEESRLATGYCSWWNDWFQHDMLQLREWYQEAGLLNAWEQLSTTLHA